jgi:hypothetical protein
MLYTTDPDTRDWFITSLHQLADYLAAHPAVPVPTGTTPILLHADLTEDGGREQVSHIARLLSAPVSDETTRGGHYTAARDFGPLEYKALSIPVTVRAWHNAQDSYWGSISTGPAPTASGA